MSPHTPIVVLMPCRDVAEFVQPRDAINSAIAAFRDNILTTEDKFNRLKAQGLRVVKRIMPSRVSGTGRTLTTIHYLLERDTSESLFSYDAFTNAKFDVLTGNVLKFRWQMTKFGCFTMRDGGILRYDRNSLDERIALHFYELRDMIGKTSLKIHLTDVDGGLDPLVAEILRFSDEAEAMFPGARRRTVASPSDRPVHPWDDHY